MKPRILFVDDEEKILNGMEKMLFRQRKHWDIQFCNSGAAALEAIKKESFDVVISDMRMPGMDGIQCLEQVYKLTPNTVRMMLTGNTDLDTAIQAVNQGNVFRFLTKPCEAQTLVDMIKAGIRQFQLISAEKELLNKTLSGSVKLLTEILTMVDPQTFKHSLWMRDSVRSVVRQLNVANAWEIMLAAMLGEIGHITLPEELAEKMRQNEQNLSANEQETLMSLPEISHNLIRHIPRLEGVAQIIRYKNKNFDGSGFPSDGISGEDIPLGARIIHIFADAENHSSKGQSPIRIRQNMKEMPGRYDPQILDAVLSVFVSPHENTEQQEKKVSSVQTQQLRIGHKLLSNITTTKGEIVVARGQIISPAVLQKIKTVRELYGIQEPIKVEQRPENRLSDTSKYIVAKKDPAAKTSDNQGGTISIFTKESP